MKKTKKRLASILLTLVMAMTLFFAAPMTVYAAAPIDPTATDTWDFVTNINTSAIGTAGGGTWSWDQSTLTLTLNNVTVNTSAAIALQVPAGTTIILNGTNSIVSTYDGIDSTYGIYAKGGALTITSSSGGTLDATADSERSDNSFGILADTSSGNITINGNASVVANGGNAGSYSGGIWADENVTISGSANVTGTGGTATVGDSVGITAYDGTLTISGNATVQAYGGSATGNDGGSFGTFYNNEQGLVINGGSLTALGDNRALYSDYVVPNEYTYWVNVANADPGGAGTVSDGNFTITQVYLFARIVFGTPPATPTPPPGAGGGANGVPQTSDVNNTLGWTVVLALVMLGVFGLLAWRRRHRAQE